MRLTAIDLVTAPVLIDTDWTSQPIWIGHVEHFSIYLQFSGVPEGTFKLEYSNDLVEPHLNKVPTNFAVVIGSEQIIDEAGTHGWNVQSAGYRWLRISFEHSVGTGYLDSAYFHGKGV